MAAIRSKNTKPELIVRKLLHVQGIRYRLHDKTLPGKPDLVFRQRHAVVFVHGCFWHGHGCKYFVLPTARREFWEAKITGNKHRDETVINLLRQDGWRVAIVWECALRGKSKAEQERVALRLAKWLRSSRSMMNIAGRAAE